MSPLRLRTYVTVTYLTTDQNEKKTEYAVRCMNARRAIATAFPGREGGLSEPREAEGGLSEPRARLVNAVRSQIEPGKLRKQR